MIETKPRINRGNRGQLFRATWLSSARCSELLILSDAVLRVANFVVNDRKVFWVIMSFLERGTLTL